MATSIPQEAFIAALRMGGIGRYRSRVFVIRPHRSWRKTAALTPRHDISDIRIFTRFDTLSAHQRSCNHPLAATALCR
jgi:3-phenylpropionate/cinnamic acid dioxygenase small subunit